MRGVLLGERAAGATTVEQIIEAAVGALITVMFDAADRLEAGVASLVDGALASLEAGLAL